MKKAVVAALALMSFSAPYAANARTCELPHERLQMRCGGEDANQTSTLAESEEALSAVAKSGERARGIVNEYRALSERNSEMVQKAVEEHKAYLARKLSAQN